MSGLEVLAVVGCVAAVVSAFHGAAELTDIIKDSKERRKKRREKPPPSIPPDLLRQSFIEGAQQVDNSSIERRQRFGVEFERGDQTAKLELMQVVINLQGEVIRALQLARDISYDVNMTTIYEYSITNRRDAINSMDHLCQRIMQNQGPLRSPSFTGPAGQPGNTLSTIETLDSSMGTLHLDDLQRRVSHDSLAFSSHSPPSDLPAAITLQRSPKESLSTATRGWSAVPSSSVQRTSSNASVTRSLHWLGRHIRKDDTDAMTIRTPRIQEVPEGEPIHADRPDVRASSLPYSASSGSEATWGPGMFNNPNTAGNATSSRSFSTSGYPPDQRFSSPRTAESSNSDFTLRPGMFDNSHAADNRIPGRSFSATPNMSDSPWVGGARDSVPSLGDRTSSVSSASSRNLTPSTDSTRSFNFDSGLVRPDSYPRWTHGAIRPDHDPSYCHDEYKHEISQSPTADNSAWADPSLSLANTLNQYPSVLKSEPLDPWVPHEKPSKANRYHGFCEGAWLTREKACNGLQVNLKPYGMTAVLPYWQCRKCQFCIRASSAKDTTPPSYIYTSSATGIKYRWIFLARSHFKSKDINAGYEAATYGCIFCVAEGNKDTLAYGKIDLLMSHIRNHHGGEGMTPEVKGRTRCIAGRVAKAEEEWDINIPAEWRQS